MNALPREEIVLEIINLIGKGRVLDHEFAKRNLGQLDDVALKKLHSDLQNADIKARELIGPFLMSQLSRW